MVVKPRKYTSILCAVCYCFYRRDQMFMGAEQIFFPMRFVRCVSKNPLKCMTFARAYAPTHFINWNNLACWFNILWLGTIFLVDRNFTVNRNIPNNLAMPMT